MTQSKGKRGVSQPSNGVESDSGLASEALDLGLASKASVKHIRSQVEHITFVKNRNQRTALHLDPDSHP